MAAALNGTVLLFNSAAERIYGFSREEVVGRQSVEGLYVEGAAREVMRRRARPQGASFHSCPNVCT